MKAEKERAALIAHDGCREVVFREIDRKVGEECARHVRAINAIERDRQRFYDERNALLDAVLAAEAQP